ncbi:MAG: alpha/beta fold hydrolase [Cytophagaceae bacterium]
MSLFYRESGTGAPLLILHGVFGSSDNWVTPAKMMEDEFHLYLIDQRNHGRSFHSDDFSYDIMADDLKDFIAEHSIKDPFIIGHSMGGKVVMRFAQKYPELYKKVIIVDIAPRYYPVHHDKILEGLNSINLENITSRTEADTQLAKYVPEVGIRQFLLKNLFRNDDNHFEWRINLKAISEKIDRIGEALPEEIQVEAPVLFINGAMSGYIKPRDEEMINRIFTRAKIQTIEGAGHWVHAEKPEEFVHVVKQFLKESSE